MRDPHLNIFHAYRGSSSNENASARQLENNLTRSLIVTLDLLSNVPVRRYLLEALGMDASHATEEYVCQLQVQSPGADWPRPQRRRLVVLHGGPKLEVSEVSTDALAGRVDAVVITSKSMLAIESKLDNVVTRRQIERHQETLELCADGHIDATWSGLVKAVRAIPESQRADPLVNLILTHFEEYLQMNGFGGLTHEHFAYFAHTPDHRSPLIKDGIRRALSELANQVVQTTGTHWSAHVMNVMLDAQDAGVRIQSEAGNKDPHLTLGIDVSGMLVMANVELQHAHSAFMRAWKRDPQGLTEIIRRLGLLPVKIPTDVPWRFRVLRRVPLGPPKKYHYYTSVDVAANAMAAWRDGDIHSFVDSTVRRPEGEAVPEITLSRSYSIPQVLQAENLGQRLAQDALEVKPFFDWIGQPFWHDE